MEKESFLAIAAKEAESLLSDINNEQSLGLANELMLIDSTDLSLLYNQSKKVVSMVVEFKELMMLYACAMKEVRTKLEILNTEYNIRYQRNPINSIKTRLKRIASITEKMERCGITFSIDNVKNNVHDVAGIRLVCSYVDDIYDIAAALKSQGDIELITEKDYIANPKQNGYRSLHLIIKVPVFFRNQTEKVKVEIQIRTIAMDFWATLEHQLKYRQQLSDGENIVKNLKECADIISETDSRMLMIRKQIEASVGEPTENNNNLQKH